MRRGIVIPWLRAAGAMGLMGTGLLLAACRGHQAPPESAPQGEAGVVRSTASAPRAALASTAKPSAPIALRYELLAEPRAGQPLQVRVTVTPRRNVGALTIEAQGSDALVLTPSHAAPVDLGAGESVSRDLTVVPVQHGRHRLSVVAQGMVDGELQAASVVVPIRVGEELAAASAAGTRAEAPAGRTGERVRALPAEERDRR